MARSKNQPPYVPPLTLGRAVQQRHDGHRLQLTKLPNQHDLAAGKMSFGVDIAAAPVPTRRYAADCASVTSRNLEVRFVFAQENLVGNQLDSALVVRLSAKGASEFYEATQTMGKPTLAEIAATISAKPEPHIVIAKEAKQMVQVVANMAHIGISGFESCMDFYHLSAFSLRGAAERGYVDVEPVVRVDIRTTLFMTLVNELGSIVKEFDPGQLARA